MSCKRLTVQQALHEQHLAKRRDASREVLDMWQETDQQERQELPGSWSSPRSHTWRNCHSPRRPGTKKKGEIQKRVV